MRMRLFGWPIVAGGLAFAGIVIVGVVLALNGPPWSDDASTSSTSTTCDLYPLSLPASALAGRAVGDPVMDLPHGPGANAFTWLTWTSDPHEYTLARSLIPPGDSYLYTEPGDPSDHVVDAGDWVERVPDALDTAVVRSKLGEHVGSLMLVPVRSASRARGTLTDDQVGQFAVIRLIGFDLGAPARVSFEFLGYRDCRNTAPSASPQSLATQEDVALAITLSGSDAEDDALSFEIATPPRHGTLSGQAPDLVYTPTRDYHGTDSFTFRARDAALVSEAATVDIAIAPVNDAPVITSTADVSATEGVAYVYHATASDPDDGDTLSFSLATAPVGMTVDAVTGRVGWTPSTAQLGDHPVTLLVTDGAGASGQQSFTVSVASGAGNRAPRIVSIPVLEFIERAGYGYQIEAEDPDAGDVVRFSLLRHPPGMSIETDTGRILWAGEGWAGNNRLPNTICVAGGGQSQAPPAAADVVVVVDESGSMTEEQDWVEELAGPLEAHLSTNGIGTGALPNRYGVMGYDWHTRAINVGSGWMGSHLDFPAAARQLDLRGGGSEDGWVAVQFALAQYPLREGVARNIILVTDEGRSNNDATVSYATVLASLRARNAVLNAVVNARFTCGDGSAALGMGQGRTGYKADGHGGFRLCANATASLGHDNTLAAYVDLAIASGGAAWNINMLSEGGATAQSFTHALLKVKTQEILDQLPRRSLPDAYVHGLQARDGWIDVDVGNRGLAPLGASIALQVHADDTLVDVVPVGDLAAGAVERVRLPWPATSEPARLRARLVLPDQIAECGSDNNTLDAAWVRVRATDAGGLSDEQAFSVQPVAGNVAPAIASTPPASANVGMRYAHAVLATDPDRGDALAYSVENAPAGLVIHRVSGELRWIPDASQQGSHEFTIVVSDLAGATARQPVQVNVGASVQPPRFTSMPDPRAVQGTEYRYDPVVSAAPDAMLRFDLFYAPAGMTLGPDTGALRWNVPANFHRMTDIALIRVRDQFGNYDIQHFKLHGDLPNQVPQIVSTPPLQASVGVQYGYSTYVSDANVLERFLWRADAGPGGFAMTSTSPSSALFVWPAASVMASHPAGLAQHNPACLLRDPASPALEPQLLWSVPGARGGRQVLVGPILDMDLDGELTSGDLVAAVVASSGRVDAWDARTGRALWTSTQRAPAMGAQPALADLDGSGSPVVLYVDAASHLVALDAADGIVKWVSASPVTPRGWYAYGASAVVVSDLDGDGRGEIIAGPSVYTANGALKWQFSMPSTTTRGIALPVDLDGDGRREVIHRGEVRDAAGALLGRTHGTRSGEVYFGYYASLRLSGQPGRHVVASESTYGGYRLSLADAKGHAVWSLPVEAAGPVIVADFTGDGIEDIHVPALNALYSLQGQRIWKTQGGNGTSANDRGATVADIDRDGELEILAFNAAWSPINVISGRTGAVVATIGNGWNNADNAAPALVDLDGDGATLFMAHAYGVYAYRSANAPWYSEARVSSQLPQALDLVRTDLRLLPADPARAPAQAYVVGGPQPVVPPRVYLPDLRVSAPSGLATAGVHALSVTVVNRGTGTSAPSQVAFRQGSASGAVIGRMPVAALAPGESVGIPLQASLEAVGDGEVVAVLEVPETMQECETRNNRASGQVMRLAVSDHGGLEATQAWVVGVDAAVSAPVFTSTAPTHLVEHQVYRYQAQATSGNVGDAITYALNDAPEGMRINGQTGEVLWQPRWGVTGRFSFRIEARNLAGLAANQSASIDVAPSTAPNQLPVIVSQPVTAATLHQVYRYDVRAADPDGHAITYSLGTAPAGMRIEAATGRLLWQPATLPSSPVPVVVVATDERQGRAEQAFTIQVHATPNRAPVITSRPDQRLAPGADWRYTVNATDADGDALTVVWSRVPEGMATSGADAAWTPSAAQAGEHDVEVEVRDPRGGVARQAFTLFVNDPTGNAAPRVTSTPNPRATVGSAYAHGVVAVDDDGDTLRYALSRRPRAMTIDVATGAITWTPDADQLGDHPVVVQVSDGRGGVAWQAWTLRVEEYGSGINRAPRIATVAPLTGKVGRAYRYDLVAGDPDGDLLAYSLVESPAGMQIDAQTGRIDWTPAAIGSHAVRVRVSDGLLWTEQAWTLQVKDGAALAVAIDPATALLSPGEAHAIRIVPTDAASQVHVALTLDGVLVPVEADLTAIVSASTPGRHVLVALVNDGDDIASAEAEFYVLAEGGADAPAVSLTSPSDGGVVTAPSAVTGSVSDSDLVGWRLYAVDLNGGAGRELARGTGTATGVLGTFDPTLLLNGQYSLVLQAWDAAGNQAKATRTVVVEGDMKLGHFSVTFEDVSVPVMGIPITITRTYDTRRSGGSLDFGHGWTVDYQNVRLHESRQLGLGWRVEQERSGLFGQWCVRPQGEPLVTVALPDGSVEKFRAKASPECQFLVPPSEVELVFEPLPGTHSQLAQTRYGGLRVAGGALVDLGEEGGAVDPDQYRLTLKDGTIYDVDQHFGLRRVGDAHGNSLTFSREGVSHSAGVGVRFIRDAAGRIVRIELPDATTLRYAYDANGDLASVTDQVDQTVGYGYLQGAHAHYLQDIVDPRNVRVSRNEYDADGRLVAQVDADGKRVEYALDIAGRTQSVRNRLGEITVYVFDDRGRVLLERNALDETIRRTYDALGNMLSEENGEGEVTRWVYDTAGNRVEETNALGQTTRWTHDRRGQVISQTNANGDLASYNRYDSRNGNLTSTEDGAGARTDLVYGTGGTLVELRQPENAVTTYGYNSRGDKVYERGPDGVETSHLYDAAGRALSESRTFTDASGQRRTLTTQYRYDDKGRLVATIDPANRTTWTEYNAIDKVSAQVDALDRRTEMTYDARGNHVRTDYPDGTWEVTVHDEENRVVAKIDRGQRATTFVHDDAGRVVETHHPDNSVETVRYDKAGREVARIDGRDNTTTFVYDDAGRLLSTTDALNRTTTTTYRADGSKASLRDALGRVTKFEYDGAGRLVTTLHPDDTPNNDADNPRSRVGYDALGRKTSTTDEMQRATVYEYNASGQLAAVVDALQQRTTYGYDTRGRKVSQTDALNRTTRWEHDDDGRVTARVLPLGQCETMVYDDLGRLSEKVDFNGQRTTYTYDAADRVVEVRHADGTGVVSTYTRSGQVETQTDAAGTTQYLYDARDRLLRVTHPDGVQVAYTYDAAGNRTRMTTSQQDVTYTHDALNRLATVVRDGQATTYAYNEVGSRQRITLPTGARTDYAYDARNRLRTLAHYGASGSALLYQTYTVDASGLRTQLVEFGVGIGATRTVGYTYDALKRLRREDVGDATRGNRVSTWTYDAVGNRESEMRTKGGVAVTTTYVYDANDRLQGENASDGTSITYQYDANGSLTGKQDASGTSVYSYDGDRRLVDAITPDAGLSYRYDANGIRQSQTVNGITTRFVVDPTATYAQVLEERGATGDVLYLLGDDRIARTQGGTTHYLHADGLGSTRLLTTDTGQGADRWWYEAFGEVESSTGGSGNLFLFAGEQLDPNLGHYYLRARYIDPANGRFTQMDAFSGYDSDPVSLHKYLYANASPVSYQDPSGYSAFFIEQQTVFSLDSTLGAINRTTVVEVGRGIISRLFLTVGVVGAASISGSQSVSLSSVAADRARNQLKNQINSKALALGYAASQILYHYTTDSANVKSIFFGKQIIASGGFSHSDGGYRPEGAYATPIQPFLGGGMTQRHLAKQLFDTPGKGWVQFFVAFVKDPTWLHAAGGVEYYRPAPAGSHVPIIPVAYGANLMPP